MNDRSLYIVLLARSRYQPEDKDEAERQQLSPLKYQRYAVGAGRISVNLPWGCGHHLRCRQTLLEGRYTGIALFERLPGKFRLLFDFNFIS